MNNDSKGPSAQTKKSTRYRIRPCGNCRERHLKCDYDTETCRRCKRDGKVCNRSEFKLRFRKFAIDTQSSFSKDQPWMKTAKNLRYVDETKITAAINGNIAGSGDEAGDDAQSDVDFLDEELPSVLGDFSQCNDPTPLDVESMTEQGDNEMLLTFHVIDEPSETSLYRSADLETTGNNTPSAAHVLGQSPTSSRANIVYQIPPSTEPSGTDMTPLEVDKNDTVSAFDRAILLRYFVQELSQWFDICDPERHFGQSVPQRARSSRTLLNAICTASARHLVRLQKYRNFEGGLEWKGVLLPHITQDTALELHNECIRDLLRFSIDPEQVQNVNLLAASIILRTDEEMDVPFQHGKVNREVFLQVTGVFIDAQTPNTAAVPHTSPSAYYALPNTDHDALGPATEFSPIANAEIPYGTPSAFSAGAQSVITNFQALSDVNAEGLRQACFWIALRQELHASFMGQRAFHFDLSKFDSFRNHSRASDAVWADRIVVFHAAVLEYCYPHSSNAADDHGRWLELRRESDRLEALIPSSFQPIYRCDSSLHQGRIFPEIWYLDNCHVAASAYFELTRILLASFDPGRPRFGSGYLASQREVIKISKLACIKVCGMALSNKQGPPIALNACAAIALCGEYFDNKTQREALIWFLRTTEEELGYPTAELALKLTEAWNEA